MSSEKLLDRLTLPSGDKATFNNSAFFLRHTSLPSPAEVRTAAAEQHPSHSGIVGRPFPVVFPLFGLLVKYGSEITIAEGQCLWAIRRLLDDSVPVPEIYGWDTDGDQVFLYMELIHGITLEERYPTLSSEEKSSISVQLGAIVRSLCTLRQSPEDTFVGEYEKNNWLYAY